MLRPSWKNILCTSHFEDKLKAVQAKIGNSDALTRDAKVLLESTLLHLGVCQGAWRMISYMDDVPDVDPRKLADSYCSFHSLYIGFNYFFSGFDPNQYLVGRVGGNTPAETPAETPSDAPGLVWSRDGGR